MRAILQEIVIKGNYKKWKIEKWFEAEVFKYLRTRDHFCYHFLLFSCNIFKEIEWTEWKYIASYYWFVISNNSWKWTKTIIMSPWDNWKWYKILFLYINKKKTRFYVHRIISELFCKKLDWYNQVNHIDWNKNNNTASNLEWCTISMNRIHQFTILWHKTSFQSNHPDKGKFWYDNKKSKEIHQYSKELVYIMSYWSIREAMRVTGVDSSDIWQCWNGKMWHAWWFIWLFKKLWIE